MVCERGERGVGVGVEAGSWPHVPLLAGGPEAHTAPAAVLAIVVWRPDVPCGMDINLYPCIRKRHTALQPAVLAHEASELRVLHVSQQ
jgi:hypothetical protein